MAVFIGLAVVIYQVLPAQYRQTVLSGSVLLGIIAGAIIATQSNLGDIDPEKFGLKHIREIDLLASMDPIEHLGLQILAQFRTKSVEKVRTKDGVRIVAMTRLNWWSRGEKITIKISRKDIKTIRFSVSSEPASAMTAVDWGQNRRNVERIESEVVKSMQKFVV